MRDSRILIIYPEFQTRIFLAVMSNQRGNNPLSDLNQIEEWLLLNLNLRKQKVNCGYSLPLLSNRQMSYKKMKKVKPSVHLKLKTFQT